MEDKLGLFGVTVEWLHQRVFLIGFTREAVYEVFQLPLVGWIHKIWLPQKEAVSPILKQRRLLHQKSCFTRELFQEPF